MTRLEGEFNVRVRIYNLNSTIQTGITVNGWHLIIERGSSRTDLMKVTAHTVYGDCNAFGEAVTVYALKAGDLAERIELQEFGR